jgi:hypothetical protein
LSRCRFQLSPPPPATSFVVPPLPTSCSHSYRPRREASRSDLCLAADSPLVGSAGWAAAVLPVTCRRSVFFPLAFALREFGEENRGELGILAEIKFSSDHWSDSNSNCCPSVT